MEETFKEIPNSRGLYEAGTMGHIRRSGRLLRNNRDTNGYRSVSICIGGVAVRHRVHRLIAETYIGIPDGMVVNHRNGDTSDNRLCNLEVVTHSENHLHAFRVLGRTPSRSMAGKFGSSHNRSKQFTMILPDGSMKTFGSGLEFTRMTGADHTSISWAKNNRTLPYTFVRGKMKGYTLVNCK